jgi:glycosyltransferase involved in cell wall biosynthesis
MENQMSYKNLTICEISNSDFFLKNFLDPMVKKFIDEGLKVKIISPIGEHATSLSESGVDITNISFNRKLNVFGILKHITFFKKYFDSNDIDILHTHTPLISALARIAAFFSKKNMLIVYHVHGFHFYPEGGLLKNYIFIAIEYILSKVTHLMLTVSNEDYAEAKKYFKSKKCEICYVGNGVDVLKYNKKNYINEDINLKKSLNIDTSHIIFGTVSRIVEEKGINEFLKTAVEISKEYKNISFLLIGSKLKSDPNDGIEIEINKAKSILQNKLHILGHRDDIPNLLSIMDVFCLLSWREGLPVSVIEAMMLSRPVIATNIRGNRELIKHNENGFLVTKKDENDAYESFKKLITNNQMRELYGKKSRKIAEKFYNIENVTNSIHQNIIKSYIKYYEYRR